MSFTNNAKEKILENKSSMLDLMKTLGVNVDNIENVVPEFQKTYENNKLCQKRWNQAHPEKLKEYQAKYLQTEKGKAYLARIKEKEQSIEQKAKRKAYRERPEVKERLKQKKREYYLLHKEEHSAKQKQRLLRKRFLIDYPKYIENESTKLTNENMPIAEVKKQIIDLMIKQFGILFQL